MRARKYTEADLPAMIPIWNEIVEEGVAFPQEELLTMETGREFFAAQSHTAVIEDETGTILGLYILHPNNVGRCSHICNPAMRSAPPAAESISARSWCWTAFGKQNGSDS